MTYVHSDQPAIIESPIIGLTIDRFDVSYLPFARANFKIWGQLNIAENDLTRNQDFEFTINESIVASISADQFVRDEQSVSWYNGPNAKVRITSDGFIELDIKNFAISFNQKANVALKLGEKIASQLVELECRGANGVCKQRRN